MDTIDGFFGRAIKESPENSMSIMFQSHVTKFDKNCILDFFYYIGLYWPESHKNTICIGFQVRNQKLSQEGCFKAYMYYKMLCTGCSTKEAVGSFFCKSLYKKLLKYCMHCFPVL